jgi:hypothetical protein
VDTYGLIGLGGELKTKRLSDTLALAAVATLPNGRGEGKEPPRPIPSPYLRGIEEMVRLARTKFVGLIPEEAWDELQHFLPL